MAFWQFLSSTRRTLGDRQTQFFTYGSRARNKDSRSLTSRQQSTTTTLTYFQRRLRLLFVLAFGILIYFASQLDINLLNGYITNYDNTFDRSPAVDISPTDKSRGTKHHTLNIPNKEQTKGNQSSPSIAVDGSTANDRLSPRVIRTRGDVEIRSPQKYQNDATLTVVSPSDNDSNTTTPKKKLQLRFNWSNLTPSIDLTRRMVAHQSNCSVPMGTFKYRNRYGLGSDLHIWGQALCNGMALNMRIRTVGNWTWMDNQHCKTKLSPMLCYFHQLELNCQGDREMAIEQPDFNPQRNLSRPNGAVPKLCSHSIAQGMHVRRLRMASLEYLFTRVTPLLLQEAERQLSMVFRDAVPKDLITVHIRWGDKEREMKLVLISEYIEAIYQILDKRPGASRDKANIYLATEDPEAVKQFREAIPSSGWNLYLDQAYVEMLPHRVMEYNGSPKMSKAVGGRAGLVALGSLLVAMEANDFVLTTASNWSRLMNELRKSIINPRCNNCTSMIDLRKVKNEW